MSMIYRYRVFLQLVDMGCVDFDINTLPSIITALPLLQNSLKPRNIRVYNGKLKIQVNPAQSMNKWVTLCNSEDRI